VVEDAGGGVEVGKATRHSESDLIRILRELNLIDLQNISHSKDRKRSG
jgi:hypothetical protein